tara:strand:+ start:325 stop:897 length:573 start_codon:yes stop_codon:yes gene_type:complete
MKVDLTNVLIVAAIGGVAYYLWAVDAKKRGRFDTKWGKAASPPTALAKQQRPLQAGYEKELADSRKSYEQYTVHCAEARYAEPMDTATMKRTCRMASDFRKRMNQSYEDYLYSIASHVLGPFGGSVSASYSINKKIAQDELTRLGIDWQARKAAAEAAKKARKAAEFAALSPEEKEKAKWASALSSIFST